MEHGGRAREYYVVVPTPRADGERPALIVFLHGGGGSAQAALSAQADLRSAAAAAGTVLAFPSGTSAGHAGSAYWNAIACCGAPFVADVDDVAFISRVVEDVRTTLDVDPNRVFATGFSNGGMLVHRLGAELPGVFAAIAPVAAAAGGAPDEGERERTVQPTAPIPILLIQGRRDPKTLLAGGFGSGRGTHSSISFEASLRLWATANGCGGAPTTIDRSVVSATRFHGCTSDVVGLALDSMAHEWPSTSSVGFDGVRAILQFFENHPKRGPIPGPSNEPKAKR